jgi:hypothetical protein
MTVVVDSGLHLTCINSTLDHRGFRRGRHSRYFLIPVFALSITANRARSHLVYRQRSRDLRGGREAGGRAEGRMSGGDWRSVVASPRGLVTLSAFASREGGETRSSPVATFAGVRATKSHRACPFRVHFRGQSLATFGAF